VPSSPSIGVSSISVAVALQDCAIAKKFIEKFKHSKKVHCQTGPDRTAYQQSSEGAVAEPYRRDSADSDAHA
jgi:hypothetical protein